MGTESLASTATLLDRFRGGDDAARDTLIARYLPVLRRWARGRLPAHGRSLAETDDLVQVTLIRAAQHLADFDARRPGAFLAYLRRILLNAMRDELSTARARPPGIPLDEGTPDTARSPVELAIEAQTLARYESALGALGDAQQAAVILHVEFGMTYPEVATELGYPSKDAARMAVNRALRELATRMK